MKVPLIPYEDYSHLYGMWELIKMNQGMWCTGEVLGGIAFVQTCAELEVKYPLFGCKGVHNYFCLQTQAHFIHHYGSYNSVLSSVLLHVSFSHLLPSAVAHRHGFSYRIYLSLGALQNTVTQLMYS